MDELGDVFVADGGNNAVKTIPYNKGAYGAPVTLGSGFVDPVVVALDSTGRLYVQDSMFLWRFER